MINVLLVAGSGSRKLAEFLEQRGTFKVDFWYEDLHSNESEIQNQIIRVDKLLYLYQIDKETGEPNTNIKLDMQTLRGLIAGNSFFNVREIILVVGEGEQYQQAKRYFNVVMQECNFTNYSIKSIEGVMSFAAVYDAVMGVSVAKDFKNAYRKMYRVTRGTDVSLAYAATDDEDLAIEPFGYDAVSEYEKQKKLARKVESGVEILDATDSEIPKYRNPVFGGIAGVEQHQQQIVLVTGAPKTGKSVWASALAKSAVDAGKRVLLVDVTARGNAIGFLEYSKCAASRVDMISVLTAKESKDMLQVCTAQNASEYNVRIEFLQNVISRRTDLYDVILINCELSDCKVIEQMTWGYLSAVCITSSSVEEDVYAVLEYFPIDLEARKMLILNNVCQFGEDTQVLTPEAVKSRVDSSVGVVKHIHFDSLTVGRKLFGSIVG